MPNEVFDDEQDFTGSEGMANLRKALDRATKRIAELESKVTTYETQERVATVAEALKQLGVNEKIAKLVPADLPVDGVAEWAKEFGFIQQAPEGEDGTGFYSEDEQADIGRIDQAAKSGAGGGTPQDLAAAIAAAQSRDELQALLRQS